MIFQQPSGVAAVVFNTASIFTVAGFSDGKLVSISVALVQLLGCTLACLAIDKTGRRILLLTMSIAMSCTLFGLGTYFEIYIPPTGANSSLDVTSLLGPISHSVPASKINWLSVVCIVLFNLFFALAWAPVPWLIMSEIFPTQARVEDCALVWQPLRTGWPKIKSLVARRQHALSRLGKNSHAFKMWRNKV